MKPNGNFQTDLVQPFSSPENAHQRHMDPEAPNPQTLNPEPQTLSPKPQAPNPKPLTPNPKPLNP